MAGKSGTVFCLVTTNVVLVLALGATLGVMLWRYATVTEVLQDIETCQSDDLRDLFPGYFRSIEEQIVFTRQYINTSYPVTYVPDYCFFNCTASEDTPTTPIQDNQSTTTPDITTTPIQDNQSTPLFFIAKRGRRDADSHEAAIIPSILREKRSPQNDEKIIYGPVYHACCESFLILVTPEFVTSLGGERVELVQPDHLDYKQFFLKESCRKYDTCRNCECAQPGQFVFKAIYYKDKNAKSLEKRYGFTWIRLPGSCKCLNI